MPSRSCSQHHRGPGPNFRNLEVEVKLSSWPWFGEIVRPEEASTLRQQFIPRLSLASVKATTRPIWLNVLAEARPLLPRCLWAQTAFAVLDVSLLVLCVPDQVVKGCAEVGSLAASPEVFANAMSPRNESSPKTSSIRDGTRMDVLVADLHKDRSRCLSVNRVRQ